MKTLKLLSSFCLVLLLNLATAANGEETSAEKSKVLSIEKQLAVKLSAPAFVQQSMGSQFASLRFHIENDFSVVIQEISASDLRLVAWIQDELAKQKILTEKENIGRSFSIQLNFR